MYCTTLLKVVDNVLSILCQDFTSCFLLSYVANIHIWYSVIKVEIKVGLKMWQNSPSLHIHSSSPFFSHTQSSFSFHFASLQVSFHCVSKHSLPHTSNKFQGALQPQNDRIIHYDCNITSLSTACNSSFYSNRKQTAHSLQSTGQPSTTDCTHTHTLT